VGRRDGAAVAPRRHHRGEHRVLDLCAGEVERRQRVDVDVGGDLGLGRQQRAPQPGALVGLGHREVDLERQAPAERLVDRGLVVGREDHDPGVRLHPLQQVVHLEVGVAIVDGLAPRVRLPNSASASSNSKHRVAGLGGVEQLAEVLLGLADPLAHHLREIDLVQVQAQLVGDDARHHRLAGAGRAGQQQEQAAPAGEHPAQLGLVPQLVADPALVGEVAQARRRPPPAAPDRPR
jgi:hypothetical protein